MRTLVPACLVALSFAAAAQQMYKWVDEKGVTHYTDSPPTSGNAQKIDIRATPPSAPVAPPQTFKEKEEKTRGERVQKSQEAQKAEADEARAKALKKGRCIEARRQLQLLAIQRPLFSTNEKGEKVYLEDKDRQSEIDRWQAQVDTFCVE
ncbi:MAG TPA: DUF4124 domain-containing protein [Usitatibacter sp.]|nr:DUF4124 domain-containing protein [Usitatibacter sp.]